MSRRSAAPATWHARRISQPAAARSAVSRGLAQSRQDISPTTRRQTSARGRGRRCRLLGGFAHRWPTLTLRRVSPPEPDGKAASPVAKCRSCRLRNAVWSERLRQQNPRAIAKREACGWGGQVRRGAVLQDIPEEFLVFKLLVLCMGTKTQPRDSTQRAEGGQKKLLRRVRSR